MMRLFVAIAIPPEIREELKTIPPSIFGARWIPPENFHLTLRFIGDVEERRVRDDIVHLLNTVEFRPFEMRFQGLGYFGTKRDPRNLWVDIEKNDELMRFQAKIDRVLTTYLGPETGPDGRKRKFTPHLSLAHLHNVTYDQVGFFMESFALFKSSSFEVSSFQLFSSHRHSFGATYLMEDIFYSREKGIRTPVSMA